MLQEQQEGIDLVKYGVLWQKVQDMDKKVDKMERNVEELTEQQVVEWVKAAVDEKTLEVQFNRLFPQHAVSSTPWN